MAAGAGSEKFPPEQFKAAPVMLTSIHGAYLVDAKLQPFTVPPNVYILETQAIGDYCLTNIDLPLWTLLQGKNRDYFHRLLGGKLKKSEHEEFIQVIKNLTYYAPGDQIYPRGLSIGGGRGSGPGGGGSSRIAYANMGFFLFPNDGETEDEYPMGPKTHIFGPLRTEMIKYGDKMITYQDVIKKTLAERPEARDGCVFVFSACAGAFNMGISKEAYDHKIHEIESLQQVQRQKFMALTGAAPGGAINVKVPRAERTAAVGKAPGGDGGAGAAAGASEPTALFGYAMREAVRGAKPAEFHPSAHGESENAMSALANKGWASRSVPARAAAAPQPPGTAVYFEAMADGGMKQIVDEYGSFYMTPTAIRLWRRSNPGKAIVEFKDGKFTPVTLGGRRRKQTRRATRKRKTRRSRR
jgi:hypothetical protein